MEKEIAKVEDYFAKIGVVAIEITDGTLKIGDTIHIKGHTTDFIQQVESMQIEKEPIKEAKVGDKVGIKVKERVRRHDKVYKIIPEETL
jgi:putative protease